MNAKEYLMQVKKLDYLIQNKLDEIQRLECLTVNSNKFGDERVQTSSDPHSKENLLIKIIELQHEVNESVESLVDLKREVMKLIDQVEDADSVDILYKRYLHYKTWEQIAVDKNLCIRQVYRIHGHALLEFKKVLEKMQDVI